jgi:hypothetical protein
MLMESAFVLFVRWKHAERSHCFHKAVTWQEEEHKGQEQHQKEQQQEEHQKQSQ